MAQVGVAPIRVVLADGDPDRAAHLCDLLIADPALQPVGIASDVAEVTPLLSQAPDILLVATDLTNPAALVQLIKQVAASAASTQVLLIGEDIDTGLLQRSVVAGARAVLVAPFEASELRETIRQVHESHLERHAGQQRAPATQRKSGAVIVIFSPKGGVGCSVLACNVAMALHQATNKRVALLDYSLQFGTIGALLNLQSPRTLGELLPHAAAIDTMMLNATLLTHSSEIKVLLPPATLEELEDVTTENLLDILDGVRRRFDYTVVDIWHTVEDATL
ncbi:MAG TPA: P-loop NTPase, partial [Chloroflexia bacterium]|nr:P-loop NTPase [Chloroflexia bacterium]